MKKETICGLAIAVCVICLAACAGKSNWNSETYAGKTTVNGVEPNEESIEKFQLARRDAPDGKKQKVIILSPENKIVGDCTIPINSDPYNGSAENKMQVGLFSFDEQKAACSSALDGHQGKFVIHQGDLDLNVDESNGGATLTIYGTGAMDSKDYTFEIKAERQ